jgi:large subunit ribosomal protein L18e
MKKRKKMEKEKKKYSKKEENMSRNMQNTELVNTIRILKKASKDKNQKIWRVLAEELDKPNRRRVKVNISRINRYTGQGEIIAVPGKVLASGWLDHPVTVAAYNFSDMAKEKIEQANGEIINLTELLEKGIDPSKIRIMK